MVWSIDSITENPVVKRAVGAVQGGVAGTLSGIPGAGVIGSVVGASNPGAMSNNPLETIGDLATQTSGKVGLGQFQPTIYNVDKTAFDPGVDLYNDKNNFGAYAGKVEGRTLANQGLDVTAAQLDPNKSAINQGYQQNLAEQLLNQTRGQGPSLAQMQLQQATDQNLKQAMALGATRQGVNPALAQRQIAQGMAGIQQQAVGQSAMARLQEQQQAQQALGTLATSARGQDLSAATADAGFTQQARLANQSAGVNLLGINDNTGFNYKQLGLGIDQETYRAKMALQQLLANQALGHASQQGTAYEGQQNRISNAIGGVAGGMASYAGYYTGGVISGSKAKKFAKGGLVSSQPDLMEFLDKFSLSNYKSPEIAKLKDFSPKLNKKKDDEDDSEFDSSDTVDSSPASGNFFEKQNNGPPDFMKDSGPKGYSDSKSDFAANGGLVTRSGVQRVYDGGSIDDPKNDTVPAKTTHGDNILLSPGEGIVPLSAMSDPKKFEEFVGLLRDHAFGGKTPEDSMDKLASAFQQRMKKHA